MSNDNSTENSSFHNFDLKEINPDDDITFTINDLTGTENILIASYGTLSQILFAPKNDAIGKLFASLEPLANTIWESGYSINLKGTLVSLEIEIRRGNFSKIDRIKSTLSFLKRYSPIIWRILTAALSGPIEGIDPLITEIIRQAKDYNP